MRLISGILFVMVALAHSTSFGQGGQAPICCAECIAKYWGQFDAQAPTCCEEHRRAYWEAKKVTVPNCGQQQMQMHFQQLAMRTSNSTNYGLNRQAQVPASNQMSYSVSSDPFGFGAGMNQTRASARLSPLSYNPSLDPIARENNRRQRSNGICGHFYQGGMAQNAAAGYGSNASILEGWMTSKKGHRELLLNGQKTEYGFHFDGYYSTLVVR